MKRLPILLWLILMMTANMQAQLNPVKWTFAAKKISADSYDLTLTADVANGWYIYSQFLESEEGPIPTQFSFDEQEGLTLAGDARESGKKKEGYDEIFGMNVVKYSGRVQFVQRIIVQGSVSRVTGSLEFMTCDDQQCLPPKTIAFSIALK